ncbi:MAG: SIS domain-containing protein [bacterium]|nr:SIS domain-containing protein [bacterium]
MTTENFDRAIQRMLQQKVQQRIDRLAMFREQSGGLFDALQVTERALREGNKLLVFGNGGSATQSSHLAAELVNKFYFERKGIPAIALTADMANITSIANDSDYKYIFSRQLQALGKEGDVALGITTSGTSANVLEAFKAAKGKNITTVALCGNYTAALRAGDTDIIIDVKAEDVPVVQEIHLFILHMMAEVLEKNLCGGNAEKW